MDTTPSPPAATTAVMVSTRVPSEDGRDAYVVHPAGEIPTPTAAPSCPDDCARCRS